MFTQKLNVLIIPRCRANNDNWPGPSYLKFHWRVPHQTLDGQQNMVGLEWSISIASNLFTYPTIHKQKLEMHCTLTI